PEAVKIKDIETLIENKDVGISVEFESKADREKKNRRTYYATSRYLILEDILNIYQRSILISDIDIDFSQPLGEEILNLKDDEIALYTNESALPWTKILAGFNIFGRKTENSEFVTKLAAFLRFC